MVAGQVWVSLVIVLVSCLRRWSFFGLAVSQGVDLGDERWLLELP